MLTAVLLAQGQVVSSEDLARLALTPPDIKQLVDQGLLHRLRRESFVHGLTWRAAQPWERHALRARAVARTLCGPGSPYLLSHHSALALHGVGSHGVDDLVHLVRTDGARGRIDETVHVHPPVPPAFAAHADEVPTVTVALACVQVAFRFGVEAGLVSTDAALREELTTRPALVEAASTLSGKGSPMVRSVLDLADGRSGSAGESRTRWMLHWMGMPMPELQARVLDESGQLVAVTDFLFRDQWTVVEFDGMLKYDAASDLRAEKVREDRLRELGYEVVRVTWADLQHPARIIAKIRAAFARSAARRSVGA